MKLTDFDATKMPRQIRVELGYIESWADATTEYVLAFARFYRNILLAESDWTQTMDAPLSVEKRAEWAVYRQALRDLTVTYAASPLDIEFPTKPVN